MKYILLFLLLASSAHAVSYPGDQNLDQLSAACLWRHVFGLCDDWQKETDTTNKMTADELDDAIDGTNKVFNNELELVRYDNDQAKKRVSTAWLNILSLFVLIIEILKTVFLLAQLFLLVHIPFFYVKLLVWVQKMVIRKWA